ncbi:HD-GYP domain-containing protein [Spirulina sp. 06S082]|uniref:HD-GYP domain-containing protein n=1 Tax=Spirulina sp. 06S082 TaxID=3110248 RepID=UPI002B1F214B|nr:HD domain-containing phosphohydrolase [Spirulina sp. 06S082]MEA5467421.1 HD domain-containing phosphohydrolase [Spirulina sp. 06S082]
MISISEGIEDSIANIHHLDRPKVMVVDDRALTRQLAVDLLQLEGYEVREAEGGAIALEIASEDDLDLILLDVLMSGMDGLEVCRRLKQNEKTAHIPILFMTLADDRRLRLDGLEAGGTDFLAKPIDRLELSVRVKSLIHQKRLNEDLNHSKQVLFSIARAIECRCSDTTNPSERLIELAQKFGEHLQLSKLEIKHLKNAAHLHDIGTIAIPDAIFLKTTPLTLKERELIRQHVLIGEQICQPVRDLQGALPIIRHHHERWDGSGYPDGIAGENIPWLAQVFQIIDIYDALTSKRPHKKPLSADNALTILEEEAERGWRNPELVAQFCAFLEGKKF